MNGRTVILLLISTLILAGCSSDDPTAPADTRRGPGFDSLDPGVFAGLTEAGFIITADDHADPVNVAEITGGDRGLSDGGLGNTTGASFVVTSANQQLFTFDSIDVCDLSGIVETTLGSSIRVEGYRALTSVGSKHFRAESGSLATDDAGSLTGLELTSLQINITSLGDDDFCVGFLELTPVATRRLDFQGAPVGDLENLFNGDFDLSMEAGSGQVIVGADDDAYFIHDDDSDVLASVVTIERHDGGLMAFETLVAFNREGDGPLGLHPDSSILIEGFNGPTLVASDEFHPYDTDLDEFDAVDLAGFGVQRLRIEIKSICGTYKCDDMAISAILMRHVE